jgi:hypothetical protein
MPFYGKSGAQGTHGDGRDGLAYTNARKEKEIGAGYDEEMPDNEQGFPYSVGAGKYGQPESGAGGRTSGQKTPSNGKEAAKRPGGPIGSKGNQPSDAGAPKTDAWKKMRKKRTGIEETWARAAWLIDEAGSAPMWQEKGKTNTLTPTIPGAASQAEVPPVPEGTGPQVPGGVEDDPDDVYWDPSEEEELGKHEQVSGSQPTFVQGKSNGQVNREGATVKVTLKQLSEMIAEAARKIKKKQQEEERITQADGFLEPDADLDFSEPLGDRNLYKRQGQANFGSFTAESTLQGMVDAIVESILRGK